MKFYQQTVILFGLVLPLLIAGAVFGVCFVIRGNVTDSLDKKLEQYAQLQQSRRAAQEMELAISGERENLERWKKQMSQETASTVTATLRAIEERIPDREFTQTSFERPTASAGFGTASAQKSSQIRLSFRGTYRSVQRAFLELETRMPQLQLQEFRISPNANQPSMHNITVSYTAWEN
jgi:hypothetical protein